jgi:hypothetical protein
MLFVTSKRLSSLYSLSPTGKTSSCLSPREPLERAPPLRNHALSLYGPAGDTAIVAAYPALKSGACAAPVSTVILGKWDGKAVGIETTHAWHFNDLRSMARTAARFPSAQAGRAAFRARFVTQGKQAKEVAPYKGKRTCLNTRHTMWPS